MFIHGRTSGCYNSIEQKIMAILKLLFYNLLLQFVFYPFMKKNWQITRSKSCSQIVLKMNMHRAVYAVFNDSNDVRLAELIKQL